jgi:hypothetical protein
MRAHRRIRIAFRVLEVAALVCLVALIITRRRHSLPPPIAPDTSHASWRGYDSGYQHPASRSAEDAHAR